MIPMNGATKKRPDFLDEVVDDMGTEDGSDYGADMDEEGVDDEAAGEDRMMAAGQVAKALGMPNADKTKLAEALKAFIATCM